jgi:hypothetical protein
MITTNNKPQSILYWEDLTKKQQEEFDDTDTQESGFFKSKGQVYCLADFMRQLIETPKVSFKRDGKHTNMYVSETEVDTWHGVYSTSAFTSVLVRIDDDTGEVIVGHQST